MLKKQSLEYAVFCVYVIVYSCKNLVRSTCGTLSENISVKIKTSVNSRFTRSNLSFYSLKILALEICIYVGVLEPVKGWHFPACATKWFTENQWSIFSNVPYRLSSTLSIFEKYVEGLLWLPQSSLLSAI